MQGSGQIPPKYQSLDNGQNRPPYGSDDLYPNWKSNQEIHTNPYKFSVQYENSGSIGVNQDLSKIYPSTGFTDQLNYQTQKPWDVAQNGHQPFSMIETGSGLKIPDNNNRDFNQGFNKNNNNG